MRGVGVFVRSDAEQLSRLAALVDSGELRVDVAERVPLAELPAVHARAATGACPARSSSFRSPPDADFLAGLDAGAYGRLGPPALDQRAMSSLDVRTPDSHWSPRRRDQGGRRS